MNRFFKFLFGKAPAPITLEQSTANPNCNNCGAELIGPFCSVCGQKKENKHDLTVWHFIGHSFHELTHFDSRFFKSFKYLLFRPGYLTEEFIAGHRKNYINPIRLFIIVNIIYLFLPSVNTFTTPLSIQMQDRYRNIVRPMVNNKIKELGISYAEYEKEFDKKIKEHAEMLIICMVLLFSVLLSLLYITQRRYYVEHLIFSLNIYSIVLVVLSAGFIFFELILELGLALFEKIMILTHFINKAEAHNKFITILTIIGDDTFLTYFLTTIIFSLLFISLKRVYRESNFTTFIKTFVAIAGLWGIILIYRLFFATFYTLNLFHSEQSYTQHWTSLSNEKSNSLPWIKFEWSGDSMGKRYFDKASMHIPVEIENLPNAFDMQFDMGSNVTMLYENPLKPFLERYSVLKDKLVEDKIAIMDGKHLQQFKGLTVGLDSQYFKSDLVIVKRDYGTILTKDSILSPSSKHIGSLGVDICHDKILILDYPNKRFCLIDKVPTAYDCDFSDFTISQNGKVLLDMTFKGKRHVVMFDNGSSIFPLMVSHNAIDNFSKVRNTDTLSVSSWGKYIDFVGRPMKDSFVMGGKTFSNIDVYTNLKQREYEVSSNEYDAITGNALFWNNVVIIDFKNRKFGIK